MRSGRISGFTTDAVRTRQTIEPLKQQLGAALIVKEVPGDAAAHAAGVLGEVESLPIDTVVLVVSHSNTVKLIIRNLGGGEIEKIEEDQFDKLFVLFRSAIGAASLAKMKYGKPT